MMSVQNIASMVLEGISVEAANSIFFLIDIMNAVDTSEEFRDYWFYLMQTWIYIPDEFMYNQ